MADRPVSTGKRRACSGVIAAERHLETLAGGATGWTPGTAVHGIALAGVAALAVASALQPALRATRVDPATILTDDAGA